MKTNTTISYHICCEMNCMVEYSGKRDSVQIKTLHMLFVPVLLVQLLAQAQDAELLLPRRAVLPAKLQLPKHAVLLRGSLRLLQPSQLRLQARLRPLPAAVRQLLLLFAMCRMLRWLPRRTESVPELPAAFVLQVPVVVLRRGAAFLLPQGSVLLRWPVGAALSRVLLRLLVLLPQVQRRMPVPGVRWMLMLNKIEY